MRATLRRPPPMERRNVELRRLQAECVPERGPPPEDAVAALVAKARPKVRRASALLLFAGFLALANTGLGFYIVLAEEDHVLEFAQDQYAKYAARPDANPAIRDAFHRTVVELRIRDRKAEFAMDMIINTLNFACNAAVLLGAVKMRSFASRGWGLAAAVIAVIPCGGCCCATFPMGLYALSVLSDPSVKAVFRLAARR